MTRMLITGGAGFVGSSLALLFAKNDPELKICCLDNLKRRGSELNISRLQKAGIRFLHGDIRNPEDLEAVGTFDTLIECSAEPSVLAGYDASPKYLLNTNLTGTLNCLEAARQNRAAFIFLSTSRVYPYTPLANLRLEVSGQRFELAEMQDMPGISQAGISEDSPLQGPRSLYGATKLASELVITEYNAMYGLDSIINRCAVLAGPWQMGRVDQGVAVLWAARHVFGGSLSYIGFGGHGHQVRDFLHVKDLYRLLVIQLDDLKRHTGKIYNVGGGLEGSLSLAELTAICQEMSGNSIPLSGITENRPADIPWYVTDNSMVTSATGWEPSIGPRKIMEEIIQWIRTHDDQLKPILG